jgi:hypothetical protein
MAATPYYPITSVNAVSRDGCVTLTWQANKSDDSNVVAYLEEELSTFKIYRKPVCLGESDPYVNCSVFWGFSGAEPVFSGTVEPSEAGLYQWSEQPPVPNANRQVYVYFIKSKTAEPLELKPIAVRNPEMWWRYETVMARLEAMASKYPELVKISVCGHTTEGREIHQTIIGTGERVIALLGAVHAGESGSELIIPMVERLLAECPELLKSIRLLLIPMVNIDGRQKMLDGWPYYIRKAANGVDLNRNFPAWWEEVSYSHGLDSSESTAGTFRGLYAACNNETQAVMNALDVDGLAAVFSFHWLDHICALPALSCVQCEGDEEYVSECREIVKAYSAGIYPDREYEDWFHGLQTSAGSLAAWCYKAKRVPAFDMEGGSITLKYGDKDQKPFTPELLRDYQERHFRGLKKVIEGLIA